MADYPSAHKTPRPQSYHDDSDSDFGFYDILLEVKASWRPAVSFALAGLLLGGAYALLAPAQIQASANVQVATIANIPVELPATLAEKMKMPLFYSEQVYAACGLRNSRAPGEGLVNNLKPAVNRSAPMINISYEGGSAAEAQHCLSTVLVYVRSSQAALAEPVINANKTQLNALKDRFEEAKKLNAELGAKNEKLVSRGADSAGAAILLSILSATKLELKDLTTEIGKLEIAMSATQTRPAEFATPIYVKDVRTRFKRLLYAVSAALAGLFLGIALVLTRNAMRSKRQKMRSAAPARDS